MYSVIVCHLYHTNKEMQFDLYMAQLKMDIPILL